MSEEQLIVLFCSHLSMLR